MAQGKDVLAPHLAGNHRHGMRRADEQNGDEKLTKNGRKKIFFLDGQKG